MRLLKKLLSLILLTFMIGCLMAGCGNKAADTAATDDAQAEATDASTDDASASVYFTKGVYVNYAAEAENPPLTYFYVFQEETYGHTDDGEVGMGVPFSVEQGDGEVSFSFGGADAIADVLTITSFENGVVTGHFDDGLELVFKPVDGADPDTFDAQNFVNASDDDIYHDANGWSIKYDPSLFSINQQDDQVFIVYTGESAGTNMITVTYDPNNNAKDAIKELGESWGDKTTYSEAPFIGMEDVTGYWASLEPGEDGSGLYMTALGRDYLGGSLIFELTGHNGEDDDMNMTVSDHMAEVMDSIEFDN